MGFVRQLILVLSSKSNLLAHQLIWNIRTNMYKNEDTPDAEMQAKLEPIARQIELNFTPEAKKFYERVFAFSDRLTKVSDTIKVYPKGNERKEGKSIDINFDSVKIHSAYFLIQLAFKSYEVLEVKFHQAFIYRPILKPLLLVWYRRVEHQCKGRSVLKFKVYQW